MNRILPLLFLLLISCFAAYPQSYLQPENNIWLTGAWSRGYGIDFNSGSPVPAKPSAWLGTGVLGGASVCDKNGRLLFYTDGNVIWNRHNVPMPHGFDFNNDGSRNNFFIIRQGVLNNSVADCNAQIIPVPGQPHKFYVFTLPHKWSAGVNGGWALSYGHLYYSVVDMELNGGLGDVDTNQRSVLVADGVCDVMCAVAGDNCNFWLLTHGEYTNDYRAFEITAAGVNSNPVVSATGTSTTQYWQNPYAYNIKIAPNRKKVAYSVMGDQLITGIFNGPPDSNYVVDVSDFDPATGIVSNSVNIPASWGLFGLAFSPDSKHFYLSCGAEQPYYTSSILQYNISTLPPWRGINIIPPNNQAFFSGLRLAPDGKIYLCGRYSNSNNGVGACIQYPDVNGGGCQFTYLTGNPLPMLTECNHFPYEVPVAVYMDTLTHNQTVPLCFDARHATLQVTDTTGFEYVWNTGDSLNTISTDSPGLFIVRYKTFEPCIYHIDSFIVERINFPFGIKGDTLSCDGHPLQLQAFPNDAQTLWQDSSSTHSFTADSSGIYHVQITRDGCTIEDSATVQIMDIHQNLGKDTFLCADDVQPIQLEANVPPGAVAEWNTGSHESSINVTDSGQYWVRVTNGACAGMDSIWIDKEYCHCPILVPNAFSPNHDGLNDYFRPSFPGDCAVKSYRLQIFNRWGQLIYSGYNSDGGWDGTYNGHPADAGTYFYRLELEAGILATKKVYKGDLTLIK